MRGDREVRPHEVPSGFLDEVADACIVLDRSWRVRFLNRRGEELLGRDRDDLVGGVLWESDVSLPHTLRAAMEQSLAAAVQQTVEVAAGGGRWFEVRCHPFDDGLFVLAMDVTSRRAREEERAAWARSRAAEAERSTALLDLVSALTPHTSVQAVATVLLERGFSLIRPDGGSLLLRDGDVLYRMGVVGHMHTLVERWPAVHLESATPVAHVARTGEPLALGNPDSLARLFPDAVDALREAGTEAALLLPLRSGDDVLGVISLTFRAPRDFSGEELGYARTVAAQATLAVMRARAIEAERAAAASAAASAAVLDALVNAAPTGLAVLDTELRWVLINEHLADMNGVPPDDHLGRTPWDIVPDLAPMAMPMFERILETGEPMLGVEIEGQTAKFPGVQRQWVEHFFPVRSLEGGTIGLGIVAQEVTDQRRMEAERSRAVRRTELLAGAAAGLARALTVDDVRDVLETQVVEGLGCESATLTLAGENPPESSLRTGYVLQVPVRGAGDAIGVLTARFRSRADVHTEDEVFLQGLASMGGPALERAGRFEREHSIAATLQHALLPQGFPDASPLRIDARYLPGAEGVEVGGDWYDVVRTGDVSSRPDPSGVRHEVLLASLGDVVGKGLHAATVMGQVRNAARGFAALDPSPDGVLTALDQLFATFERDDMATLALVAVDPAGSLTMALAGHLPPILLGPDGSVTLLEGGRSMPLGAGPGGRLSPVGPDLERTPSVEVPFPPGSTLVMYSDGLIESTRLPVTDGLTRLETLARAIAGLPVRPGPGEVADLLTQGMVGASAGSDDVAVLVIDRPASLSYAVMTLPDGTVAPRAARNFVRRWWVSVVAPTLGPVADVDQASEDVELVTSELVTNGLRHAGGAGLVELDLRRTGDRWFARVGVIDRLDPEPLEMGDPSPHEVGGRGLQIVARLGSRWGVEQVAGGKRVWAEVALPSG